MSKDPAKVFIVVAAAWLVEILITGSIWAAVVLLVWNAAALVEFTFDKPAPAPDRPAQEPSHG